MSSQFLAYILGVYTQPQESIAWNWLSNEFISSDAAKNAKDRKSRKKSNYLNREEYFEYVK